MCLESQRRHQPFCTPAQQTSRLRTFPTTARKFTQASLAKAQTASVSSGMFFALPLFRTDYFRRKAIINSTMTVREVANASPQPRDSSRSGKRLADDHVAVGEVIKALQAALNSCDLKTAYAKLDLFWARLAVHIRAEHLHLFPAVIQHCGDVTLDQAVARLR